MNKLERCIWFCIKLLPIVFCILVALSYLNSIHANTTTVTNISAEFNNIFTNFAAKFRFLPVFSALINVIDVFIPISTLNSNYPFIIYICSYVSYLVFVVIVQIMYKVLVFLPEFLGNFFEGKERKLKK